MFITELNKKKVAVLGLGYIGSNLLAYLKKNKVDAIGITRQNLDLIKEKDFDFVINCAGSSGDFRKNIIETIESNVSLNAYILQNTRINFCYVYLSSTRIYGFSEYENNIFDERSFNNCYDNLNLNYIYDGSKKLSESLLLNYSKKVNYKIAILRLSNVYGNFNCLDDSTLVKRIIRYKKESLGKLVVNENKNSKKDYIHINDVIENIINVMLNIKKTNTYNMALGKSYSLDDISKILQIDIKCNDKLNPVYSNISNNKIKKDFSIVFKTDFENGLKKL